MRILFISRKKLSDVGGLSRFAFELTSRFPLQSYTISPDSFSNLFALPFLKIDVIHLSDATLLPFGLILKTLFGKPLVVTAHGLDLTFPNFIYQWMLRLTLNRADIIVLNSHPAKKLISPFSLPDKKINIINPGISVNQFKKIEYVKLPRNGKTVLLTVGNLVKRKGHVWFIENVLTKLPDDFIYFIVGKGTEQKTIEEVIKKNNLEKRVYLLGRLNNKQLAYVFSKTAIYVCPNQKEPNNFESFGIANAEAAAMGLPVVASRVDGISEAIKNNKNGWLVRPNAQSFIDAITNLNKHGKKTALEGEKARLYTQKNYAWEKSVKQYLMVFQKAIYKT